MLLVIIILLLIIVLGTVGGVSWWMLGNMNREPEEIVITPPPNNVLDIREWETFSAGEIQCNLLRDGTRNYLAMGTFSLEVNTKDDTEGLMRLLESKRDVVRDIINTVLRNTTYEELSSPNGADRVKEQILNLVCEAFQTNRIVQVNIASLRYQQI